MKLNSLKAEQIKNGEIPVEDAHRIYGKENVDSVVAALKKSDAEILAEYSCEKMKSSIFGKTSQSNFDFKNVRAKVPRYRFALSYSAVSKIVGLAAVIVIAFALVFNQFSSKSKITEVPQNSDIRIKGNASGDAKKNVDSHLVLYKKTSDGAVVLKSGDRAAEGDFIQISYYPGTNRYGIIFSVDGNKNVTKHFPEKTWTASPLGNEADLLDFSYELDDAPEFEDFIFLASEKQFSISEKEAYKVFSDEMYLEEKYDNVSKFEVLLNK